MIDKEIFELGNDKGVPDNSIKTTLGQFVCIGPTKPPGVEEIHNRYSKLNFTGQPGTASQIYFSLVFHLPKIDWFIAKIDEWIEVSPTHREYFERTMSTKQALESTIKTGLASAAQSVADFELMSHDVRKYTEILEYFQSKDENVLKSMFIDQVDIHTDLPSQPIALRTIVSRWPTIIADFMRINDNDVEPDKIAKDYDISKAEAVILVTKNKLYQKWKKLFGDAAKDRYMMLRGLLASREKSIKEYKEWLKPYIARFNMTKLGMERPAVRSGTLRSFADITGISGFANKIRIFAWKPMKFAAYHKPAAEVRGSFILYPYDDYVRENFIVGTAKEPKGLSQKEYYPWLRNPRKHCPKCKKYYPSDAKECEKCKSRTLVDKFYADQIVEEKILSKWTLDRGLDPSELYYVFLDVDVDRVGTRLQSGEIEDITFYSKVYVLSQNIMLVKLLELECRDLELENYIDEMLGIKFEEKEIGDIVKSEFEELFGGEKKEEEKSNAMQDYFAGFNKTVQSYRDFFKKIKLPKTKLMFFKRGPYEVNLQERMTKQYLRYSGVEFGAVTNFIKSEMGVGE